MLKMEEEVKVETVLLVLTVAEDNYNILDHGYFCAFMSSVAILFRGYIYTTKNIFQSDNFLI